MNSILKSPIVNSLVIIGGLIIIGLILRSPLEQMLAAIFPPPSASIITSPTIVQQVQPLGQLVTYRMPFAKANISVIVRYGAVNICRIGALHTAEGIVEAGVDLQQITVDSIRFDEASNTYFIQLPSPQITSCSLDPMNVVQYHTFGEVPVTCPADMDEIRRMASYVAVNEFRDTALDIGILEEAEVQARQVIQGFVSSLTNASVEISFAANDEAAILPASCRPQVPGEWVYSEISGDWRKP